jgi:hypothetical protein
MKKFYSKLEAKADSFNQQFLSQGGQQSIQQNQPSTIASPTTDDIFRYRFHHGTNLGSVFVLEKWLSGSMFPGSAKGESELDAVTANVKEKGADETKNIWENHWRTAVSEDDWQWLKNEARCTSIRLPVGWWIMGGQQLRDRLHGTEWKGLEGVYGGAWVSHTSISLIPGSHGGESSVISSLNFVICKNLCDSRGSDKTLYE